MLQFDPVTSKASTPTVTTEAGPKSNDTTQDKTESTAPTAPTVTVTPTVAMTTSGGITANVTIETEPNKTRNDSETSKLHESNKQSSETPTVVSEQVEEKKNQAAVTNDSLTADDASKKQLDKNPGIAPGPEPPVSPTGSLHSDSGASATGVRSFK